MMRVALASISSSEDLYMLVRVKDSRFGPLHSARENSLIENVGRVKHMSWKCRRDGQAVMKALNSWLSSCIGACEPKDRSTQTLNDSRFGKSCKLAQEGASEDVVWCRDISVKNRSFSGCGILRRYLRGPWNDSRRGKADGGREKEEGKVALPTECWNETWRNRVCIAKNFMKA